MKLRPQRKHASLCFYVALLFSCMLHGGEKDAKMSDLVKARNACSQCLKDIHADLKDLKSKYPQLAAIEKAEIVGGDEENVHNVLRYEYDVKHVSNADLPVPAQSPTRPVFGKNGIKLAIMFSDQVIKMGATKKFDLDEVLKGSYCIVEVTPQGIDEELSNAIVAVVEKRVEAMRKSFQKKPKGKDD